MSDLYFNKLAFCVLSTGLLMTGLNEASHAMFPPEPAIITGYPLPDSKPSEQRDYLAPDEQRDYHALFATADVAAGKSVSVKCMQCHYLDKGGSALAGPPLFSVLGRDIGSSSGFRYSTGAGSLSSLEGAWTYEKLDRFLERPTGFAPGTAMNFPGIRRQEDRVNLIAYLRTLTSGEPEPLP
jgi:cytochrome c